MFFPGTKPGMQLGQNNSLTLFFLVWGWVFRNRGQVILAGIVWGLLAYKPVWAMSFFFALLLLREFRMAAVMVATGVALGLSTLPWVGLQAWFDWLKIGKAASELYAVDASWIPLSRDLFGIPRRFLINFHIPRDERWNLTAHVAGWLLWLIVFELTLRVFFFVRSSPFKESFVMLAAWLLTYHFVYYDTSIAAFPFLILLASCRQRWNQSPHPSLKPRFAWKCYLAMVLIEYVMHPLHIKASVVCESFAEEVALAPDCKVFLPRMLVTFDEWSPWNTLIILALWGWCGLQIMRSIFKR